MALHFLDNVLLLDFSLEPAQGVFQRLALLKLYFCQTKYTSKPNRDFRACIWNLPDDQQPED
jgi:hypothetical protein